MQVDRRNSVKERRAEQTGGRVDEGGDLEELATDNGIGLTCGQHPVHKPVGGTRRRRSSSFHLWESQVGTRTNLPGHTNRFRRGAEVSSGQIGNARRKQSRRATASNAATDIPCP